MAVNAEVIPVVWWASNGDSICRGYWDQAVLEALFDMSLWHPVNARLFAHYESPPGEPFPDVPGAVVVVPARHHAKPEAVEALCEAISALSWAIVVLTGDEESVFPWWDIRHENFRLWIMDPDPRSALRVDAQYIGSGFPPQARPMLAAHKEEAFTRGLDFVFAGQVTHPRRAQCVAPLRAMEGGVLVETKAFTSGLPHDEYYALLAEAKIAPCPSGPVSLDSFRLYEALEAGCLPLADGQTPHGPVPNYYETLFGETPPFPVVENWATLPAVMTEVLEGWPANANRAFAWWTAKKRDLAYRMQSDLDALDVPRETSALRDQITVLMPTSPIPSHPDTKILEDTVCSVREQLGDVEILLMCDGVRKAQRSRTFDYEHYLHRALWLANYEWGNVLPLIYDEHLHQAEMTRRALDEVRTLLVLFVEHDTPLVQTTDWRALAEAVLCGDANIVRLYHEAELQRQHRHLHLDREPVMVCGAPMIRTYQFSARPHLASTDHYRRMLDRYFAPGARCFIEDLMHGVVQEAWLERGWDGWREHRIWIYHPEDVPGEPPGIKRSTHTDGRADDPKYEQRLLRAQPVNA